MTYAPQYQPAGHQPAPQPKNGFGVTSLVLGIVGAVFAIIPVVGVIAWPMVIIGLIFGVLAILRARKGVATNQGVAIAGTALSGLGLALCIIWAAAFGAAVANTPAGSLPPAPAMPNVDGAPATPGPAEAPAPGTIPGDGTFVVGTEVQPGTYRTAGPNGFNCYYARMADTSGELTSVITNGNASGPTTITIAEGDGAFQSSGCQTWTKVG